MAAPITPFNSVKAKSALIDLSKDVRRSNLDVLDTEDSSYLALSARSINKDRAFSDMYPNLRRTRHIGRPLIIFSISTDLARKVLTPSVCSNTNAARQLIVLSATFDTAVELLIYPISTNWSRNISDSSSQDLVSGPPIQCRPVPLSDEDLLRQLLELCKSSEAASIAPITSAFSEAEFATAAKLLDLFTCSDSAQLDAAAAFTENEFLTAHSLLDRFAFPKHQGPADFHFGPDDVAAANQFRALFAPLGDLNLPIGPLFLAAPNAEGSPWPRLLSTKVDGLVRILKLSIQKGNAFPSAERQWTERIPNSILRV